MIREDPSDSIQLPGGSISVAQFTRARVNVIGRLVETLATFEFDPYGFVLWAFPWGEEGTALEKEQGPETWQREQLERIGQRLRDGADAGVVIEEDVAAGHGVGKSALVAWMILWAISTHPKTRGVVTANTEVQLQSKTWAELSKWYQLFIGKSLFRYSATRLCSAEKNTESDWRIDAIPWSKNNAEAFAGLHNKGRRILCVFDEASAIDDLIWDTTEGALTDADTQIIWVRYGNPTRTSGRFHSNFQSRKRNRVQHVDSRSVRFTNKGQIEAWREEYGEDSDFFRVRVRGQFPRAGASNFISAELVFAARQRIVPRQSYEGYPLQMAVDPARFGDDWSVITMRQGFKVHFQQSLYGFDGPELAGRIREIVQQFPSTQCIAYDAIGNGADLDSALRRMPGLPRLVPVMWGVPAADAKQYFNQRAECWGAMRDWLKAGQIPNDDELANELTSLDYGYDAQSRIQLTSKKDIKRNGGKSPDHADSLALSFVPDLMPRPGATARVRTINQRRVVWTRTN